MKFDTLIIGGGLAGLVFGIALAKKGQRCVVVSSGQSALHFSSGSFDLLNTLPDGSQVSCPDRAWSALAAQAPTHPYVKLGKETFVRLASQVQPFLQKSGVLVQGSGLCNQYRITPMGTLKSTWLTLDDFPVCRMPDRLPWKKVAIFNMAGFLDFYTQFIVDEFRKIGTESSVHLFHFAGLECLRKNPSEMRSTNIARMFEKKENLEKLVLTIRQESGDAEVVLLPAIVGLVAKDGLEMLRCQVEKPLYLLPTLPPSVPGIRTQQILRKCFQDAGGVYMLGDTVKGVEKEGNRIARVYSCNHGDIPFVASNVVLATGSYFSQGLIATPDRVYEPVADLDVVYETGRDCWYDLNLFARQHYQDFGVKTDAGFRGIYQGNVLENLYVAGALLEGFNPIREGSGAGVSILSALYVAEQILSEKL